ALCFDPNWHWRLPTATVQPVTLDDHSKVVTRLPIPNRTVKRLSADDSGRTSVKVGHRQALIPQYPTRFHRGGLCLLCCANVFEPIGQPALSYHRILSD